MTDTNETIPVRDGNAINQEYSQLCAQLGNKHFELANANTIVSEINKSMLDILTQMKKLDTEKKALIGK